MKPISTLRTCLGSLGKLLACGGLACLVLVSTAGADEAPPEKLTVFSSNPFNFVAGLEDASAGGAVELEVELTLPAGAGDTARLPVVLFVHGAGGPQKYHSRWLDFLHAQGYATAYTNHFAPRGKGSAVGSHIQLTGAAMTADAFAILKALGRHPRVDRDRIAIMGASKGGGVALYTSWELLRRHYAPENRFAAHIALYPTCVSWNKPDPVRVPIKILVGAEDDWTGVDHCRDSVKKFRDAGFDNVSIQIYPDAAHGFDSGLAARAIPNAYNVTNCRFTLGAEGRDYAEGVFMAGPAEKRKALGGCIARGTHFGANDQAFEAAKRDVKSILSGL